MTSEEATGWWAVLLDGALGSVVGTVASVLIAVYVIKRQLRSERALAREERRHAAALSLLTVCHELSSQRHELFRLFEAEHPNAPEGWDDKAHDMARREQYGLPLAVSVGGAVARSYLKMNESVFSLWQMANEPEFVDPPRVLVALMELGEPIGDITEALREHLVETVAD